MNMHVSRTPVRRVHVPVMTARNVSQDHLHQAEEEADRKAKQVEI